MKKAAQLSYIRFPLFPRARERISVKDILQGRFGAIPFIGGDGTWQV